MAREIKPATHFDVHWTRKADEYLRLALKNLKSAGASPACLDKVRAAQRSVAGAVRHVEHRYSRTKQEG